MKLQPHFNKILVFIAYFLFVFFLFRKSLGFDFIIDDYALLNASSKGLSVYGIYWLHPGTVIESYVILNIFGHNNFIANFIGILLRSISGLAAYFFISKLTYSKKLGFASGIFLITSYVGIQSTTWFTNHLLVMLLILTLFTSYRYLIYISTKSSKDFIVFLIFFLLTLITDPGRSFVFPIFIAYLFIIIKIQEKKITFNTKEFKKILLLFIVSGANIYLWYKLFGYFTHSIIKHYHRVPYETIMYFFGSIANLFITPITRPFEFTLGVSNNLNVFYILFSIILITIYLFTIAIFIKTRNKTYMALSTLFFWMYIFYVPNWLSYPRNYVPSAFRYLTVSGFGFVGIIVFISYIFYSKNKIFGIFLFIIFFVINLYVTNFYINQENVYRSKAVLSNFWNSLNRKVSKRDKDPIIYLSGDYSLVKYGIVWSSSAPLKIKRGGINFNPIISEDLQKLVNVLCLKNIKSKEVFRSKLVDLEIYSFLVSKNGNIRDNKVQAIMQIERIYENKNSCSMLKKMYGNEFSYW